MNYHTYKMNMQSLGFTRTEKDTMTDEDIRLVEMLKSHHEIHHIRYMKCDFKLLQGKQKLERNSKC